MKHGGAYLAVALCLMWCRAGWASEPVVPPGLDPGGVSIALLGGGVDYTKPSIAIRLARDGEGDLIAWDFTDNDIRPFAKTGGSNSDADHIVSHGEGFSLVIVKERPGDPAAVGYMAAFTTRTPARIIVWPDGHPSRPDWRIVFEAAQRFTDRLFIVPQPDNAAKPPMKSDGVVLAAPADGNSSRTKALDLAVAAAGLLAKTPQLTRDQLRKALASHR
ncbi:MAG: hypothetical protein OER56_17600 [Hyphomicrobiales bacterium]|nr:hypothetical protein [Hyphomicrobiales bacterium]